MARSELSISHWPRGIFGGFFSRVIAFWIDKLLIDAFLSIVMFAVDFMSLSSAMASGIETVCQGLIAVTYFTLLTYLTNGWTVGKAIMGLRTIALDADRLSFSTAFVREGIGKMILMHFSFLGIIVLFSEQRENFMDFFTDTRVVSEHRQKLVKQWQTMKED